jgi:REP element-mobilizing transposase RayT
MPDHAHLLVEGTTAAADFRVFAARAKQRAAMSFARRYAAPLWQEGYYDRILREGDDVRRLAAYILANPVRAGLVPTPSDYPHVGSDVWTVSELLDSAMFGSER